MLKEITTTLYLVCLSQVLYLAAKEAYEIRLHAITEYGRVIHEFDPYFNYRATKYLWSNGWQRFSTWFDYESWYPLGRPVGTTIYPGMQVTSVLIKQYILPEWSINDICCFVPAWFGVLATLATAMMAYEASVGAFVKEGESSQQFTSILAKVPIVSFLYTKILIPLANLQLTILEKTTGSSWGLRPPTRGSTKFASPALESAVITACIMAIVPAHLMRSVGGGYDNESVAMSAMTTTFYCWMRSLRGNSPNLIWGVISGVAYFYMVASWGGYVFVLNIIGVHAVVLVLLGRYSNKLYQSYTAFYVIGTMLATTVPVVRMTPLKSLEQMGPLLAFVAFQVLEVTEIIRRKRKLSKFDAWRFRVAVALACGLVTLGVSYLLVQQGYFGPISARVRGLFVKHTKTGNPLVDSVAEHQAASSNAYFQYLDNICYLAPLGFGIVTFFKFHDSSSFLIVYAVAAYYFSQKMVRLILLTAPIAAVLAGICLGNVIGWGVSAVLGDRASFNVLASTVEETENDKNVEKPVKDDAKKTKNKKSAKNEENTASKVVDPKDNILVRIVRVVMIAYFVFWIHPYAKKFHSKCRELAKALSHPTIIQKGRTQQGEDVTVDDYRQAYWWLRDNTPKDSRVLAWWDYGYQIAGIANRTTIADGNTWNHEHIALLGKALTSSEKEGHRIARHLADYVLIWTGGGGDDLAKSPHMRRIANSVYRELCPRDPTCRSFGVQSDGHPTPSMRASLLYTLHSHGLAPGVEADKNRFKLVHQTKFGKVRIFKVLSVSTESKKWVANPANRICDAPGSWYCKGQYPPALQKILKEKKDFKQLEDFNIAREDDSEYQRQYMENLNNPEKAVRKQSVEPRKITKISADEIASINSRWEDNEITTRVWEAINQGNVIGLKEILLEVPQAAHIRSKDGRGPMWWAHEYGRKEIIKVLKTLGVRDDLEDEVGLTPLEVK